MGEEASKLLGPDYLPNDEASVRINAEDQNNPRLLMNIPANKIFINITDSKPPMLVVVVRADNIISAKGALMHAHDFLMAAEPELIGRTALTQGVKEVAQRELKSRLAEGVA